MKAIIPAAGIGKRLQPHTLNRPKVMVPVAGKPILEHISHSLFSAGFDEISVIVGYKKETIIDYFSKKYPGKFNFPVQEEMKGLGHAILYGLDDVDEPVLIILGDTIIDLDITRLIDKTHNMIAVVKVNDPTRFGIVETDADDMITAMVEKPEDPQSDLAIAGVYYIQNQKQLKKAIEQLIDDNIKTRNEYQLTDALALMMKNGVLFKAMAINEWYDCGTKETLLSTSAYLLSRGLHSKSKAEDCRVIEPVYIGENSNVSGCVLGPNVAIGDHVILKESHISNSMINDHATIKKCILHDSIVGVGAKVENYIGELNIGDGENLTGNA